MSLTTRVLPPDDWPRLADTDLRDVWALLSPSSAQVLVVEDEAGAIVGHCVIATWIHAEGFGVREDHRNRGDVWRRLLHAIGETSREVGNGGVIAGAASAEMAGYLARLGGIPLPASFFTVPMNEFFQRRETEPCRQ
jgi:hypothetical protein